MGRYLNNLWALIYGPFFWGTEQTALDGDKATLIHSYSSQNNSHTKARNRRLKMESNNV